MNDEKLVRKAKKGDKNALLELIVNRKDEFYKLAYSYMKNEADAMNVMQDMIVKLYENIEKLRKNSSFYSWSKTVLVNICKDYLKFEKSVIYVEGIEYFSESFEENHEDRLLVEEMILGLNIIHREVIELRYILGYSYNEIAEVLEIPEGTVKSRINTAMKNLKEKYKEELNV